MKSSLVVSSRRTFRPPALYTFASPLLRLSSYRLSSLSSLLPPARLGSFFALFSLFFFFHGDRAKIISFQSAELIRFLRDPPSLFVESGFREGRCIILRPLCRFISSTVRTLRQAQISSRAEMRPRFYPAVKSEF